MSDSTSSWPKEAQNWLEALNLALTGLPTTQHTDILAEALAHIRERLEQGLPIDQVLQGFGDPKAYAASFQEDYLITAALEKKQILPMLSVLLRWTRKSLIGFLGFIGVITFGSTALASLACMALKPLYPQNIGLWASDHEFNLGFRDKLSDAHLAQDLAGIWIYPILLVMIILFSGLTWLTLIGTLKGLKSKPKG